MAVTTVLEVVMFMGLFSGGDEDEEGTHTPFAVHSECGGFLMVVAHSSVGSLSVSELCRHFPGAGSVHWCLRAAVYHCQVRPLPVSPQSFLPPFLHLSCGVCSLHWQDLLLQA